MLIPIDNSNLECYFNLSQHYEADFSSPTGKRPNSRGLYDVTPLHQTHTGYLWYYPMVRLQVYSSRYWKRTTGYRGILRYPYREKKRAGKKDGFFGV